MSVDLKANGIKVTPKLKSWLNTNGYMPTKDLGHTAYSIKAAEALLNEDLDGDAYLSLTENQGTDDMPTNPTPDKVFSGQKSASTKQIRVKAPSEGLDDTRYAVKNAKTGKPLYDEFGQQCSSPSEKSQAQAGVLLKLSARKSGIGVEISDWEKTLLDEMIQTETWASFNGDAHENKLIKGGSVKALLDDAPSGGLEIAPITFDSDIISNVLLTGELLPNVTIKPVSRGRRVEGASVSHPTVSWGTAEGTAGTLQDFSSFVSSVDTTIYPATCFCEVGRDFLSDSAVDVGSMLTGLISEKVQEEMDGVIAAGNGTTQPEGVMQKSGTTAVAFGGAMSVGNMENLLFSVPKQYRKNPSNSFAFCGTETTYSRMRAMAVGTTDARRLFGFNHESYEAFPPRKFLINEDLTNAQMFAGDLKRYRLYKRLGLSTQWSTEGKTLQLANTALLSVRFRYGGQVVLPAAFGVVTDAPA